MALFPQQFIDDLRLQANIVQVVQEHVSLKKRRGITYKGPLSVSRREDAVVHVDPLDKGSSTASAARRVAAT